MKCLFYNIIYILFPLNAVRARLIDRHLSTCPHCASQLLDNEDLRPILENSATQPEEADLWLKVRAGIRESSRPKRMSAFRLATIGMAAALVVAVLFVPFHKTTVDKPAPGDQSTKQSDQIIIKSVEINERPGKTFYFKSHDNDRLIVWVQ